MAAPRRHSTRRGRYDRELDAFFDRARDTADEIASEVADEIHDVATALAPLGQDVYVDDQGHAHPGWLKESIQKTKIGPAQYKVTVRADYGKYVEFGTLENSRAPQPFFTPAVHKGRIMLAAKASRTGGWVVS